MECFRLENHLQVIQSGSVPPQKTGEQTPSQWRKLYKALQMHIQIQIFQVQSIANARNLTKPCSSHMATSFPSEVSQFKILLLSFYSRLVKVSERGQPLHEQLNLAKVAHVS